MVVRKSPVEIAIEPCDLTAEKLQRLFGHQGRHAISTVDDDVQAFRIDMGETLLEIGQIVGNDGMLR